MIQRVSSQSRWTMADPDIRLGRGNLICFQLSHVYFFVGGPKSIYKLAWGHGRISLLDPLLTVFSIDFISIMLLLNEIR